MPSLQIASILKLLQLLIESKGLKNKNSETAIMIDR